MLRVSVLRLSLTQTNPMIGIEMAKRIEESTLRSQLGRPAIYTWEDWTDGTVWRVYEGEDYVKAETLKGSLRNYATKNGYRLRTISGDTFFDFQFTKRNS